MSLFCVFSAKFEKKIFFQFIEIQFVNESNNFETRIGGKVCNFVYLYRSPSKTQNIFEKFADNFELTLVTHINNFLSCCFRQFQFKNK